MSPIGGPLQHATESSPLIAPVALKPNRAEYPNLNAHEGDHHRTNRRA
jgi:hypothetical protein